MSATEFRENLEALGWPDGSQFAFVYGVPHDRVKKWMGGDEDIPPAVRLVVKLLHQPGARTLAVDLARATSRPSDRELDYMQRSAEKARAADKARNDG